MHDVEIIDTAGQEEFLVFRNSSISKGDGFLGLFAINSVASWYHLKDLRSKIIRDNDNDKSIPMVIIANKSVREFLSCSAYLEAAPSQFFTYHLYIFF